MGGNQFQKQVQASKERPVRRRNSTMCMRIFTANASEARIHLSSSAKEKEKRAIGKRERGGDRLTCYRLSERAVCTDCHSLRTWQ